MDQKKSPKKSPWTLKRIAAIVGIVLLAGMYVTALVAAIFDFPGSDKVLRASFAMTLVVPLFLFIFIWAIGRMTGKRVISDPEDPREASNTPEETKE